MLFRYVMHLVLRQSCQDYMYHTLVPPMILLSLRSTRPYQTLYRLPVLEKNVFSIHIWALSVSKTSVSESSPSTEQEGILDAALQRGLLGTHRVMATTTTHSSTDSQKMRLLVDRTVAMLRWKRV